MQQRKILQRTLRGNVGQTARQFTAAIDVVLSTNSLEFWLRLLPLPTKCLNVLKRPSPNSPILPCVAKYTLRSDQFFQQAYARSVGGYAFTIATWICDTLGSGDCHPQSELGEGTSIWSGLAANTSSRVGVRQTLNPLGYNE